MVRDDPTRGERALGGPGPAGRLARLGFTALAWLFVAGVLVQVFLVGLELFEAGVDESLHRDFAYLYGWLLPGMLLLGRVGRVPLVLLVLTLILLVLYAAQTIMPALSDSLPILGPLHALNAVVLFSLGVFVAQRGRRAIGPGPGSGAEPGSGSEVG